MYDPKFGRVGGFGTKFKGIWGALGTLTMTMTTMWWGTTYYVSVDITRTPEGIRVGRGVIVTPELHSYVDL